MPKTNDERFLDEALGNVLGEEDDVEIEETGEDKEDEEEIEVEETKLTKEEIVEIEKETGKKLTEQEIKDLGEKKKEELEIPEDFTIIDPAKLPKELQGHFKRMLASYTKKMQGIGDVTKKAELWDYLQQNPQFFADKVSPTPERVVRREGEKEPSEVFLEQLNLPEDNELSPTVKYLAKTVFDLKKGVVERDQTMDRDNFRERLDAFFEKNDGMKEDIEFIRTMDRIGTESPNLYRNLERLKKYASAELGREPKVKQKGGKVDIYKLYKDMKEAKKNKTFKPTSTVSSAEVKKSKNVKEAMALAEDQLKRERR